MPRVVLGLAASVALAAAGCGGGGGSSPRVAGVTINPVQTPPQAPAPPALVDAGEQDFEPPAFEEEITPPQQPTVEPPSSSGTDTLPNFFPGFQGGGEIPGAARGAATGNSPLPSGGSDAFADTGTLGFFGVRYVSATEIRGNFQYADSGAHLATVPRSFADTGLSYPNQLVYEPGGSLSVESTVITYYRSGYRNDLFHERSWFAVIAGEATVNGVPGYTFAVFAEDRSDPENPNDTRTGKDFAAITIFAPDMPYGGSFERNGLIVWGMQGVVYHNQYPLRAGDLRAMETPAEPTGTP